ncbi:MAG: hypothetical protein IZT59_07015 [Verrucomicrobia bacterium]|nr:hypothetical protein [Verrucomicrobiota bacterium]
MARVHRSAFLYFHGKQETTRGNRSREETAMSTSLAPKKRILLSGFTVAAGVAQENAFHAWTIPVPG